MRVRFGRQSSSPLTDCNNVAFLHASINDLVVGSGEDVAEEESLLHWHRVGNFKQVGVRPRYSDLFSYIVLGSAKRMNKEQKD